jgi:hypothetical protein
MYTKKVFIVPCISPLHVKRATCDKFGACEADNVQYQQSQKRRAPGRRLGGVADVLERSIDKGGERSC